LRKPLETGEKVRVFLSHNESVYIESKIYIVLGGKFPYKRGLK